MLFRSWADAQYHDDLIQPWAQRLTDYVDRLGLLYAISEGAPQVDLIHTLRAIATVEQAKDDVLTIVEELMANQAIRERDKVLRFITQNPGITSRELQRRAHLSSARLEGIVAELRSQERIVRKQDGKSILYFAVTTSHDTNVTKELSPVADPK